MAESCRRQSCRCEEAGRDRISIRRSPRLRVVRIGFDEEADDSGDAETSTDQRGDRVSLACSTGCDERSHRHRPRCSNSRTPADEDAGWYRQRHSEAQRASRQIIPNGHRGGEPHRARERNGRTSQGTAGVVGHGARPRRLSDTPSLEGGESNNSSGWAKRLSAASAKCLSIFREATPPGDGSRIARHPQRAFRHPSCSGPRGRSRLKPSGPGPHNAGATRHDRRPCFGR
jgi:hypothetical protein